MFGTGSSKSPKNIGFLLLPQFSMIAFSAALEPLRAANRVSHKDLYSWKTLSLNGQEISASNQVSVTPDLTLKDAHDFDIIFVCAGVRAVDCLSQELKVGLRNIARKGIPLGAVCTGTIALADAGLLSGYRCTIHWENLESFREVYPAINVTDSLYEIDRDRFTCSGGTAALDMMIHGIRSEHGESLAMNIAEQMMVSYVRDPSEHQRLAVGRQTAIHHPKLSVSIETMRENIENPIPLDKLAKSIGISLRQLERLFSNHIQQSPAQYYLGLRLQRARHHLRHTAMPSLEISIATGFSSASHFSQSYKKYYGYSPKEERKNLL